MVKDYFQDLWPQQLEGGYGYSMRWEDCRREGLEVGDPEFSLGHAKCKAPPSHPSTGVKESAILESGVQRRDLGCH